MGRMFHKMLVINFLYRSILVSILFLSFDFSYAQNELKIKKIDISGNKTISSEALLKQLNTTSPNFFEKILKGETNERFSNFTFDEDIIRLKKYYQQNGFLNPIITTGIVPGKKNKKVSVFINIEEGDAILIAKIEYSNPSESAIIQTIDSLRKIIPLKKGLRFRDADVFNSEKMIKDGFAAKGFPFVEVKRDIDLRLPEKKADIFINIKPGQKSFFGDVEILGDAYIPRTLINKNIQIKKGNIFSISEMEKTRKNLMDLGLFNYATVRANLDSVKSNVIPVIIQLKELPRWSLKTGVGYGTEDKIRISTLLTRLNFMGGARTLIFKAQHSYFNPINIDVKFIQPDLFKKDLELIVNPFISMEREESYDVRRIGSALTLQKEITKSTNAYISYTLGNDYVKIKNGALDIDQSVDNPGNNKSGITLGIDRSAANDLFYPSKGNRLKFTGTYMGIGFNSKYHYYKLLMESTWYIEIIPEIIIAGKIKGGIIEATQQNKFTPIEDRFLMGGAMSLRGWGRHQISISDESGSKFGGNTMLESSLEIRFPVYEIVSATAFIDAGNIWKYSWDAEIDEILYNAGFGIRIKTPVGPVRMDLATQVFEKVFDPQFFITIGHAF